MKILRRLNENLEMYLLMIFLVVMTMVMGMQIFARYVLNSPLSWSEEVARFMFVWSGFVSVSYCIQKGIAIRIEQLVDFLPAKLRKAVDISVTLILLAYFIYILPYAYDFFFRSVEAGQLAPATQIPMALIYAAPLTGFGLAIFRLFQNLLKDARSLFIDQESAKKEIE